MNKQLSLDALEKTAEPITPEGSALVTLLKPEAEADLNDFDWLTDKSVIVPEQQAIAVYRNPKGELVIRQMRAWCDEEDRFIVIHDGNVETFLDKLCDVIGIPSAGK